MIENEEAFQERCDAFGTSVNLTRIREMVHLLHGTYQPTKEAYKNKVYHHYDIVFDQMERNKSV